MARRAILVVCLLALGASTLWLLAGYVELGVGRTAKLVCSATFVSRRNVADILSNDAGVAPWARVSVSEDEELVTAHALWIVKATAVFRSGHGCTLVHAHRPDSLRGQSVPHFDRATWEEVPLVDAHGPALTSSLGVNRFTLERALYNAFERPALDARPTQAVVVLYRGFLVAEGYHVGIGAETPLPGGQMTASVFATIYGRAKHKNMVPNLDQPVALDEWTRDGRSKVTFTHLLRMSSGLRPPWWTVPFGRAPAMLFRVEDIARSAVHQPLGHEPGEGFGYSPDTTNILSLVLRRRLGERNYREFPYRELFKPLGLRRAIIELDASGTFVASNSMYATAREWAKLGQLHLQNGVWNGERLLSSAWVDFIRKPAAAAPGHSFGAHWWLNGPGGDETVAPPLPSLPRDTYWMRDGSRSAVVVIPSRQAVVVRISQGAFDLDSFASQVLSGLPRPRQAESLGAEVSSRTSARTMVRPVRKTNLATNAIAVATSPPVIPHQ